VRGFESECDKIGARVEIEASNCDRTLSALEREDAKKRKEDLQRVLKELELLREIKESVSMLWNKIDFSRTYPLPKVPLSTHVLMSLVQCVIQKLELTYFAKSGNRRGNTSSIHCAISATATFSLSLTNLKAKNWGVSTETRISNAQKP
jgi:hypothetical protein